MNTLLLPALLLAAGTLALASCKKDDDIAPVVAVTAKTVTSLSAAGTASATGQPIAAKHYTFYSLADGKEIAYTDSNSTKWDVAFRGTTILTNSGTSGPGQGGAQVLSKLFSEVATAPTTDYAVDAATTKAIPTGSGNGWYSYNSTTNVVTPIAGRVLAIRTALGKYAKIEVQNYYKDAPAAPTSANPAGYYTFRYVYQPSGTALN
ncbi:HmuY family protein [Hymenobacter arcticus]